MVRALEFQSEDPGFDPLAGQGEEQFFCPSESKLLCRLVCSSFVHKKVILSNQIESNRMKHAFIIVSTVSLDAGVGCSELKTIGPTVVFFCPSFQPLEPKAAVSIIVFRQFLFVWFCISRHFPTPLFYANVEINSYTSGLLFAILHILT